MDGEGLLILFFLLIWPIAFGIESCQKHEERMACIQAQDTLSPACVEAMKP